MPSWLSVALWYGPATSAVTYVDVIADGFREVTLNGRKLDTAAYRPEDGLALPDLAADNTLVVDADLLYTNTGEGLHRFVDPVDGEVYLYSQFETADAKRMYACFDQPDLKAPLTLTVVAATSVAAKTARRNRLRLVMPPPRSLI